MKRALLLVASFAYLNTLFTFENVPSTPALTPVAKLSVEVVILVGLLALVRALGWRLSRIAKGVLVGLIFSMTLVRYVDVTALGVLGREFDLYGDFPHLHRVFAMFWEAMSLETGLLVVGATALVAAVALGLNWMAISVWERALETAWHRRAALAVVPLVVAVFSAGSTRGFAFPTSAIVAKQIRNLRVGEAEKLAAAEIEWPARNLDSSLEGLDGANVFLIFLESYGVTLIEDAQHSEAIAPRFDEMTRNLERAGYRFASSQIHSPTFGGGSWRAHATLLSGFHIDSEHLYNALLESERETLVSVFDEHGYRTVAVEPGIKWFWPDGEFYGFDRIYAFDDLDYGGPPMGWWKIPDQYTLYHLYREEIRDAQAPLFAKLSLIMSHIPYFPVPDYVDDWSRFDDGTAYEAGLKSVAHDAYTDLRELSTWYVEAFRYELDIIEGFLLQYVPENSLVIVVGDHQPPKLVTHDNDSWAVPIHVFSKREELVQPFEALGFEGGLVPLAPTSLRMADFMDGFLEIFDDRDPIVASAEGSP